MAKRKAPADAFFEAARSFSWEDFVRITDALGRRALPLPARQTVSSFRRAFQRFLARQKHQKKEIECLRDQLDAARRLLRRRRRRDAPPSPRPGSAPATTSPGT